MSHSAHDCHSVRTYEQAKKVFEGIKPPRNSTKQVWANPNVRPLKKGTNRTSYTQYRIHKQQRGSATYYDVMLYDTIIARYHQPTINDKGQCERVIYYNYFNSLMTREFMASVVLRSWREVEIATTGEEVMVPTGFSTSKHRTIDPIDGAPFTLRRVLVEVWPHEYRLDIERSHHTPFYTKASTQEDKEKRARVRSRMDALLDLACMRLPTMEQEAVLNWRAARPFGGHTRSWTFNDWRGLCDPDVALEDAMTEEALTAFLSSAQEVYNILVSKRAYMEGASYFTFKDNEATALKHPVTEMDFRTSMMRFILDKTGANQRNGRKYLPMWAHPSKWPRSGIYAE